MSLPNQIITKNFEDYPEHRLKFFSFLHAIAAHCFPALIRLSSQQLKLVMDSIVWAFRHTERNIAETGLNLLLEMLKNFQNRSSVISFSRHTTCKSRFSSAIKRVFSTGQQRSLCRGGCCTKRERTATDAFYSWACCP